MAQLIAKDLCVGYEGRAVLRNLNFEISAGDYLCIAGENGSGKSTLMKTILGFIPPVSGTIMTGDGLQRNEIGYLPQQTLIQKDFPASVEEIVLSGRQGNSSSRFFYSREDSQIASKNMERMGVRNLARSCYRLLSGGQQQRVLLARALCAAEKMLLLDEPVAGLDPKVTEEMYALVAGLNREGMTIVMISHDLDMAVHDAKHILYVGKPVFYGSRQEYLKCGLSLKKAGDSV